MADKQVNALTSSTPTVDDLTISYDNADTSELKKTTWQAVRDLFKTYFDTIYQAVLVSWTNIKTVNWNSLLGSGDITISGGASTLDSLTDVVIATPTTWQALVYDGTQWENTTLPGGGDALTTNPLSQFAATTSLQLKNTISDETGSGSLVFATSPTLVTPVLGTPASWTLTNCIDLPLAGLVDINTNRILGRSTAGTGAVEELNVTAIPALIGLWTSDSPQFTGVNIGHATDTTMTRESSWQAAIEWIRIRLKNPLVVSATSYTTDTGTSLNMDNLDMFIVTAQAGALLFNAPGGTLVQGRQLIIRIKDNGTARALTWNAVFRAMGTALPSTTVLSKTLYLGFIYSSTDTKWDLIASAQEA